MTNREHLYDRLHVNCEGEAMWRMRGCMAHLREGVVA